MHAAAHLTRTRLAVAALSLLALAAVTGCGSGDDTGTAATTTVPVPTGELSAAKLASAGDDICTAANDQAAAKADIPDFGTEGLQSEDVKASTAFWEANADAQSSALDQLSQLEPPPSLEKKWQQFLDLFQRGRVDYSNDLGEASVDGDTEAFFDVALKAQTELRDLDASAKGLGMKVCGASQLSGVS